ncbi:MAG TPA: hypothetical protein VF521_04430 [Pyrinomonadaceae bacterium]|jgi:hypothetical protein
MKFLTLAIVLSAALLLSLTPTRAQEGGPPPIPKRKFNHRAEIVSVYDKSADITSVVLQWYPVDEESKHSALRHPPNVRIRAGFGYAGKTLKETPSSVRFDIGTDHEGESYFKGKEMPELVAFVDGEQIGLGKTLLERSKTTVAVVAPWQTTFETLSATFTYQGLLRIANAKKVRLKAGALEFELGERQLEALRDLASRMAP